jgi:hypothetical protein
MKWAASKVCADHETDDQVAACRALFLQAGRPQAQLQAVDQAGAVACGTSSRFQTGARVSLDPANDSPQFHPVMAQAAQRVRCDRVLPDAAFDSE